jgi:hypothetical protein
MAKDTTRVLTARYATTCATCREPIEVGEKIARKENANGWKARGWNHARCEVTWLCDGRTIEGSGGVALHVAINALGERVGDNRPGVLGGIAEYAPTGSARAAARDAIEAETGDRDGYAIPYVVETGVHGATRINRNEYATEVEALAKAERWAASNSTGHYWAEVSYGARIVRRFNLDGKGGR